MQQNTVDVITADLKITYKSHLLGVMLSIWTRQTILKQLKRRLKMKLTWFAYKDTEEPKYQLKITYFSFFGSPKLKARNAYRARIGMPIIVKEHYYAIVSFHVGQYFLNVELTFQEQVLGPEAVGAEHSDT
jgi:hypothetical protein